MKCKIWYLKFHISYLMIHDSYFGQGIWLANEDAVLGCVLIFLSFLEAIWEKVKKDEKNEQR